MNYRMICRVLGMILLIYTGLMILPLFIPNWQENGLPGISPGLPIRRLQVRTEWRGGVVKKVMSGRRLFLPVQAGVNVPTAAGSDF